MQLKHSSSTDLVASVQQDGNSKSVSADPNSVSENSVSTDPGSESDSSTVSEWEWAELTRGLGERHDDGAKAATGLRS